MLVVQRVFRAKRTNLHEKYDHPDLRDLFEVRVDGQGTVAPHETGQAGVELDFASRCPRHCLVEGFAQAIALAHRPAPARCREPECAEDSSRHAQPGLERHVHDQRDRGQQQRHVGHSRDDGVGSHRARRLTSVGRVVPASSLARDFDLRSLRGPALLTHVVVRPEIGPSARSNGSSTGSVVHGVSSFSVQ